MVSPSFCLPSSLSLAFQSLKSPVRKVVPNTYREAVDFLDGRRRREKLAEKVAKEHLGRQTQPTQQQQIQQLSPEPAATKPPSPGLVDLGTPTEAAAAAAGPGAGQ